MRAELAFAFAFITATAAGAQPLLLTPVIAPSLDEGERSVVDAAIRAEVSALGVFELVPRDAQGASCAAVPCDGAVACSVARGAHARAANVLVAEVAAGPSAADPVTVKLVLLDVAAAAERRAVVATGERAQLRRAVREAVVRALAPDRYVGRVNVEVGGLEAEIVVDGVVVGRSPLLAAVAVTPARHELEVRAPGLTPYRGFVDVGFDALVTVALVADGGALVVRAPEPAPASASAPASAVDAAADAPEAGGGLRTAGMVATIAGGAVLVAGAVVTLVAFDQKARFERDAATVDEIRANLVMGPTGLVLLGVGGVGLGAGVALLAASAMLAEPADDTPAP